MRKTSVLILSSILLLGGYAVYRTYATSSGIIGQSRAGCGGGGCHGSQSTNTVVKIWADSSTFVQNKTYIFHISVANASEAAAGCDISVDNSAKLATSGSGLQLFNNELTHTQPRSFTGDSAV